MAGETEPDVTGSVDEHMICVTDDHKRMMEDEYWTELQERIDMGEFTPDQAIDEFLGWRSHIKTFGEVAINGAEQ